MDHHFFAYCPLSYDGEFFPDTPPGCSTQDLFQASSGFILCLCAILDSDEFERQFEKVRPYLVGERLHRLLQSALRWPPAIALAKLRLASWESEHLSLDQFEKRLKPLLQQCLERQNRIPGQLVQARIAEADLHPGEYYWVLQGDLQSKSVRWVTADYRLCEGPPELFHWHSRGSRRCPEETKKPQQQLSKGPSNYASP